MGILLLQVEFEPRRHETTPDGETYLYTFPNNYALQVETDDQCPGKWRVQTHVWYLAPDGSLCSTIHPHLANLGATTQQAAWDVSEWLVMLRQKPALRFSVWVDDDGVRHLRFD